jgi:hypothetical protein
VTSQIFKYPEPERYLVLNTWERDRLAEWLGHSERPESISEIAWRCLRMSRTEYVSPELLSKLREEVFGYDPIAILRHN